MVSAFCTPAALSLKRTCAPQVTARRAYRVARTSISAQLQLGETDGAGAGGGPPMQAAPEDKLLGEMMFCEPDDLSALIAARRPVLDDAFFAYVDDKIDSSDDLEERTSLRMLMEAVKQLMKEADDKQLAKAEAAKAEQNTTAAKVSTPADKAQATYNELIDALLEAQSRGDEALRAQVVLRYDNIDKRMLELLDERARAEEDEARADALRDVLNCINKEMEVRLKAAMGRLSELFSVRGGIGELRAKVRSLADSGGIDEPFILLLQSNIDNAKEAGENEAVQVMTLMMNTVKEVVEMQLPIELQLIRRLLRTESRDVRVEMLLDAFSLGKQVATVDGGLSSGVKVDGKAFVSALRELIEKYGAFDKSFIERLSQIGEESEAVARKIYGMEGKDVTDLQREAFHKRRVSVWDLEGVEVSEEAQGTKAPWLGKLGAMPQGFNEDGKMSV